VAKDCLSGVVTRATAEEERENVGRAAFAQLQSLVGEWEARLSSEGVMRTVFRPIAFGTAQAHEEWRNGEQLTATVFYVVGSELHAARQQSRRPRRLPRALQPSGEELSQQRRAAHDRRQAVGQHRG
jgi:hypothetical protein